MGNQRGRATNPQPLHPAVQALREECARDLDAAVQTFVHIVDKEGHDRILKYRYGQNLVAQKIRRQMQGQGFCRLFVLKSRQIGITTQIQNRNNLKALCMDNISVATVAHRKDRAEDILKKAKYAYARFPELLQLTLSQDAKAGFEYADTGSNQVIVPASDIEAIRSGTKQDIQLSEWPLYSDPEEALTESSEVCHRVPGTSLIIEGTGKGEGSYAHQFWRRSKRGQTIFEAQFLAWQDDPECAWIFRNDADQERRLKEAYEYEPMLKERGETFRMSPGHIYWGYQVLRNDLHGNWEKFLIDFPCTDEECWRSKGDIFFGDNNVTRLEQIVKNTTYEAFAPNYLELEKMFSHPGELTRCGDNFDPVSSEHPYILIFQPPRHGHQYVACADSGEGTAGGDPSCVAVTDMHTGEDMAEFWGVVQPHQNANMLASLCKWYNGALAGPEINNQGLTTLNELLRIYRHIYQWRILDNVKERPGTKLGWYTGMKSRARMLSLLVRVVEEVAKGNPAAAGMIRSPRLVAEMRSFKENPETGKPEAAPGFHDDVIITRAICWAISEQETKNMSQDIINLLRPQELNEQNLINQPCVILPKFDVAESIAMIRRELGMEENHNVVPLSETADNKFTFFRE